MGKSADVNDGIDVSGLYVCRYGSVWMCVSVRVCVCVDESVHISEYIGVSELCV